MNYKILSLSKYKIKNITLYGLPSKNNIIWSAKYNIRDNIFEISKKFFNKDNIVCVRF